MQSRSLNKVAFFHGLGINIVGLSLFAALVLTLFPTFSALEGRLYPVANKAEIVSLKADGAMGSIVQLKFTLTRSCTFEHLVWSRVLEDGTREAVRVDIGKPLGSRGEGTHLSQEWRVAMSPEDLKNNSIAFVWHKCHPGWSVISQFYP